MYQAGDMTPGKGGFRGAVGVKALWRNRLYGQRRLFAAHLLAHASEMRYTYDSCCQAPLFSMEAPL